MMKIAVQKLPEDGLELIYDKEAGFFSTIKQLIDGREIAFDAPVSFTLTARPEREVIRVDGRLATTLRLNCSRCLESFTEPLEQSFTLRYSNRIPKELHANDRGAEIELTGDEIGLIFFQGEEIDLRDELEEQVILALPFKPVCRETCKGLCPQCGSDLNRNPCGCKSQAPPKPFEKLKNLKLK